MAQDPTDSANDAWCLDVQVNPGARRNEVTGWSEGRLRVRLQAPPVEGKANDALVRYLAAELGLRRNQVRIRRGESSRRKTLEFRGCDRRVLAAEHPWLVPGGT
jgi:uncharacterized protein